MTRVNLGTARIVVIVALVVAGLALLANGFGDGAATLAAPVGGAAVSPTGSPTGGTASPTGSSPAPTLPSPQPPADVTIAVFNGTSAAGLAAQGQQTLLDAGYAEGQPPADAPVKPVAKTTVYYRTGSDEAQNQSDAQAVADGFFKGAKVEPLGADFGPDVVKKSVIVVVVLGDNYANKVGG
jgi:hypothetical protein